MLQAGTAMKKNVLIADEEEAVRESVFLVLEDEGYDCTTVAGGEEIVSQMSLRRFDLIIINMMTSGIKEIQLIKNIRDCSPSVPILILISYSDIETIFFTLKNSSVRYLLNPIDFDELLAKVHQMVTNA